MFLAAPTRTPSRALFPWVAPNLGPLFRASPPLGGPELPARAVPAAADTPGLPERGPPVLAAPERSPLPVPPHRPPGPPGGAGGGARAGQLPPGRRGLTKTRVFRRAPAAPRPRPGSPARPRSARPGPARPRSLRADARPGPPGRPRRAVTRGHRRDRRAPGITILEGQQQQQQQRAPARGAGGRRDLAMAPGTGQRFPVLRHRSPAPLEL